MWDFVRVTGKWESKRPRGMRIVQTSAHGPNDPDTLEAWLPSRTSSGSGISSATCGIRKVHGATCFSDSHVKQAKPLRQGVAMQQNESVTSEIGSSYLDPTFQISVPQDHQIRMQADHLSPDDLIEEFLSDEAAVVGLAREFLRRATGRPRLCSRRSVSPEQSRHADPRGWYCENIAARGTSRAS